MASCLAKHSDSSLVSRSLDNIARKRRASAVDRVRVGLSDFDRTPDSARPNMVWMGFLN